MEDDKKHEHRFIVLSKDERWLQCSERGCEERILVSGGKIMVR